MVVGAVLGKALQCRIKFHKSCHIEINGVYNTVVGNSAFYIVKIFRFVKTSPVGYYELQPFYVVGLYLASRLSQYGFLV